ncbi:MAG: hypothetical protein FWD15_04030, partial [Alphaproteobacteria bacterium]|nr:hypothetical protein [Alphaproteobacteria bacterium]
ANHADPPSPCHSGLDPESNLKHNADSVSELRFSSGEARQGGSALGSRGIVRYAFTSFPGHQPSSISILR